MRDGAGLILPSPDLIAASVNRAPDEIVVSPQAQSDHEVSAVDFGPTRIAQGFVTVFQRHQLSHTVETVCRSCMPETGVVENFWDGHEMRRKFHRGKGKCDSNGDQSRFRS